MQHDEAELAGLYPVDYPPSSLDRDFTLPAMSPPDKNITIIEQLIRQTLLRVIHTDRTDGKLLLLAEVVGYMISKKVRVRGLLFGLLFIPDDNSYGLLL